MNNNCFVNVLIIESILMFISHSVKHFAVGRRRNFRGQLMFHTNVERVGAVVADVVIGVAFFATGALTVAVVVKNGGVKDDDFNKTII